MNRREFLKKSLEGIVMGSIPFIYNCEKNPVKSESANRNYFPLSVGNKWNYKPPETDVIFTIFVYPKTEFNGKEYFVVDWRLLREENGIIYTPIKNEEYVYLDFTRPIGEKWQYPGFGESWPYLSPTNTLIHYKHIASRDDIISVRDISLTNCIQVIDEFDIGVAKEWYAPDIGLVVRNLELKNSTLLVAWGGYGSYSIHSAVIEGKSIP